MRFASLVFALGLAAGAATATAQDQVPSEEALAPRAEPTAPAAVAPITPSDLDTLQSLSPDYRIGAGDILEVAIVRPDERSYTRAVSSDGTITLPVAGSGVQILLDIEVAGLTPSEAENRIVERLGRDYLVDPYVEVRVKEYRSQFVTVTGEINQPGRKPLQGRTRLFDILLASGGFTARASGQVLITRRIGAFEDGTQTRRVRLTQGSIPPQDLSSLELPLHHGDVIAALQKYYVTVEGEVTRPGRIVVEDDTTVSAVILTAGGLTKYGKNSVKVRRIDPASGKVQVFEVDLKDVRNGKKPDPPLQANDVLTVGRRLF